MGPLIACVGTVIAYNWGIAQQRMTGRKRGANTLYSYANPTVPEINELLPLPPAQLPPWDGKLQWLEVRLANVPLQKPARY
ncbi:hypothetical protein D3C73_1486230 [compost metagenome]